MLRRLRHVMETPDFRVRIRGIAYEKQPGWDLRVLGLQFAHHVDGRIGFKSNGEQQLIRAIILLEEGAQVGLESFIQAGEGL